MRTPTGQFAYANGYQDCLDDIKRVMDESVTDEDILNAVAAWIENNKR